ncbi:MAG: ELWxxDGT repeat protein [Acidobacteriota bacterium]
MRTRLVLILLGFLCALPALGLEPYVVKDINPVSEPAGSSPGFFAILGSAVLFGADDGVTGRELWRSDGTEAGTWLVADLCQPSCSGNPRSYGLTGRSYFFRAADADTFESLWATDGTPAGTFQLTDRSMRIEDVRARIGNILYFVAWDGSHGEELWRSDGTPAGTYRITDLLPGPDSSAPRWLTVFKGSLWFSAFGPAGGALWRTDGTAAGTAMVKDPVPAFPENNRPEWLRVVGGRLVFVAPTRQQAGALWSSDGTARGTEPLRGVFTAGFTAFLDFSAQGGRLYFIAEDTDKGQELWVTDGTAQGTRRLTNLPQKRAFIGDTYFLSLPRTGLGNRFVFAAFEGKRGIEPWITDGTPKGTRLLKDLCPGACSGLLQVWERAQPGRLYLTATDGTRGAEPWVTDGTAAGTRLVKDLCPGSCDSNPLSPYLVGSRLVFVAAVGSGYDVWSTDGTGPGTARIVDFPMGFPLNSFEGAVVGNQLLFAGNGLESWEPWRTDGTAAGTRIVRDINQTDLGGSDPRGLMPLGDEVFFFADYGGGGPALWKSDGTAAGTLKVSDFEPVDQVRSAEAGGVLFFRDRTNQLWRTDGTEAGTFELGVQLCCNSPEIAGVGGTAFFPVREGEEPFALWASDGSVAGTRQVRPGDSGPMDPSALTAFQGKLYFAADDPVHGRELWASDGTAAGTFVVKDIRPGSGSSPILLTVHAGRLWFFADDGAHGLELWSSDGTAAGTVLAADLEPGAASFGVSLLVSLGDRLLMLGGGQTRGAGIWVSDGTAAGTSLVSTRRVNSHAVFKGGFYFGSYEEDFHEFLWVADATGVRPVFDQALQPILYPRRFAALDGHLLFDTGEDDVPLWATDGTPAGTFRLLPETFPDSDGAAHELVRAGSRVFFPAFSREDGVELWAVEEAAP